MKRLLILLAILGAISTGLVWHSVMAQEKLKLTAPIAVDKGADEFDISLIILDWKDAGGVRIDYSEINNQGKFVANGKRLEVNLRGEDAQKFLFWIAKANFSTNPLKNRVTNRLQTAGAIPAGTFSGEPAEPTTTTSTTTTSTVKVTTTTLL